MPRLENLPHAALAEPFQQDVLSEQQAQAAILEELVDLIRRQPAALQEIFCQQLRVGKATLQARDFLQVRRWQAAALMERVNQGSDRVNGHRQPRECGMKIE
jgi:hypothetical protein